MKLVNRALIVASLAVLPLASHVADAAPLTRAEVRAQLIAAEQSNTFHSSKNHYPDVLPDFAAAYVANKAARNAATGSYGPDSSGTSASGSRALQAPAAASVRPQADGFYRGH